MPLLSNRRPLLAAAAGLGLSLLSALPAGAHGGANAGLLAGASHPLLGLDHLLLLIAVGGLASVAGPALLLAASAGALLGAGLAALAGPVVPAAEMLAALAIAALGALLWRSQRHPHTSHPGLLAIPVAAAVAIHALLHAQEASGATSWWVGATLAAAAVVGITYALLRQLDSRWTSRLAVGLGLAGLALTLAPLA